MASEGVRSLLGATTETTDQKGKVEAYGKAMDFAVSHGGAVKDCTEIVDHVLSPDVSQWVSRDALQYFTTILPKLPREGHQQIAEHILERVQPRSANFEEQVTALREQLSALLEGQSLWARAAETLTGINLDSHGNVAFDDKYKLQKCLKIATLFLRAGQPARAETFVNRAAFLLISCPDDLDLQLQYKSCYAKILDSKCKFLEAALRYYEISNFAAATDASIAGDAASASAGGPLPPTAVLLDGTRMSDLLEQALIDAVVCTILASAGPQRSRVLATLYKDERCIKVGGSTYQILQKVYMERILRPHEVQDFSEILKPHQKATMAARGDCTVLEHAVIEHNLQSVSRLYKNISFAELGRMLGIDPLRAEKTAAGMIVEGRMGGQIDQVDGFIYFSTCGSSDGDGGGAGAGAEEEIANWDQQIRNLCQDFNAVVDTMQEKGYNVQEAL